MEIYERTELERSIKSIVAECAEEYMTLLAAAVIIAVLLLGSSFSFWLGLLLGLAIPYYIIPKLGK